MRSTMTLAMISVAMMIASSSAIADSYAPFTNYRAVDATGRYYVVVKKSDPRGNALRGVPVAFEIVERRPGSAAVVVASEPRRFAEVVGVKPEPMEVRAGTETV